MANDQKRLLELALEALEGKRREIDLEIANVTRQLRGSRGKAPAPAAKVTATVGAKKRNVRFTREERKRRSERMKAYWTNWRKQKKSEKA